MEYFIMFVSYMNLNIENGILKLGCDFVLMMCQWPYLPTAFVKESGLARKKDTMLRDPQGKEWPAVIKITAKNNVHLSCGWPDFLKANKLKVGDTCLFTYIRSEGNLIQVQVLNKSPGDPSKQG